MSQLINKLQNQTQKKHIQKKHIQKNQIKSTQHLQTHKKKNALEKII